MFITHATSRNFGYLSENCIFLRRSENIVLAHTKAKEELTLKFNQSNNKSEDLDEFHQFFYANFGAELYEDCKGKVAYCTIWKANSENIYWAFHTKEKGLGHSDAISSIDMLNNVSLAKYNTTPLRFTFVREPLKHFISGVAEAYIQRLIFPSRIVEKNTSDFLIANHTVTPKIAAHVIASIVRFDFQSMDNFFLHRKHFAAQANTLLNFKPHFVGRVENSSTDWVKAMQFLGYPGQPLPNEDRHPLTHSDFLSVKMNLRKLFISHPKYLRALCWMLLADYKCLEYELPQVCADIQIKQLQ
jgi:hypothetical protein